MKLARFRGFCELCLSSGYGSLYAVRRNGYAVLSTCPSHFSLYSDFIVIRWDDDEEDTLSPYYAHVPAREEVEV